MIVQYEQLILFQCLKFRSILHLMNCHYPGTSTMEKMTNFYTCWIDIPSMWPLMCSSLSADSSEPYIEGSSLLTGGKTYGEKVTT